MKNSNAIPTAPSNERKMAWNPYGKAAAAAAAVHDRKRREGGDVNNGVPSDELLGEEMDQNHQHHHHEQQQKQQPQSAEGVDLRSSSNVLTKEQPEQSVKSPSRNASETKLSSSTSSALSSKSEYCKRLPSQQVSFGSAEVLTVAECLQHGNLYQNRSVRVTGILSQRGFQNGENVTLDLMDPVGSEQTTRRWTMFTNNYNIRGTTTPSRPPTNTIRSGSVARRPGFHKSSEGSMVAGKKRPLSATTPMIETQQHYLRILADPLYVSHLDTCSEKNLIMVMGTLMCLEGDVDNQSGFCVQARWVQNVDQTDMTLYTKALLARRKMLFRRYYHPLQSIPGAPLEADQEGTSIEGKVQDPATSDRLPLQGCGPPPYDALLQDET